MHSSSGWDQGKVTNMFELLGTGDEPNDQKDDVAGSTTQSSGGTDQEVLDSNRDEALQAVLVSSTAYSWQRDGVSRPDPRFHPVKTSNNWRADVTDNALSSRLPSNAASPQEEYHRYRGDGPQNRYSVASGPRTHNGVYWASIRRGTIVMVRDVRRCYDTRKKIGGDGIIMGPDSQLWTDQDRLFFVKDRYWSHIDARAVYTHNGEGLKRKSLGLKQQAMCIQPLDPTERANWTNEAFPNAPLEIKWLAQSLTISPLSSIYVVEALSKDINEDFWIVGEVHEESVEKMEALEEQLRRESRAI